MRPRTVTDMISWMMPAMRSSTAACAAGGTVLFSGSRSVRGGVGRRGQRRALAHRAELSATLLGSLWRAAHKDARADACEDPADCANRSRPTSTEADDREDGAATGVCSA